MTSINQLPQPSSPSTSPPLPAPISNSPTSILASITPLSLPSEGIFASFNQLYDTCQRHARLAGYAFAISKSEKREGRVIKILLCKRGGTHQSRVNEDYRIRNKSTFKSNCQASIKARERLDGSWTLQWRESQYCTHNHEPGDPSAFPEHRRLSRQQLLTVNSHYITGIPPSRTVAVLRQEDPTITIHHRDIYNITAAISRSKLQNSSPPEAFVATLKAEKVAGKVYFEWTRDLAGHINMIFVADMRLVVNILFIIRLTSG
jgi:FAR1 DNA-binding domain